MKTHRTDLVSLVPGVLFVGIAIIAFADRLTLELADARWVWPALLIVLGLAVLASAGLGRSSEVPPVEPDRAHDEVE